MSKALEMEWGGKPMSETVRELRTLRQKTDAGGGCFHPEWLRKADRYAFLNDEQICTAYLELLAKAKSLQAEVKRLKSITDGAPANQPKDREE